MVLQTITYTFKNANLYGFVYLVHTLVGTHRCMTSYALVVLLC